MTPRLVSRVLRRMAAPFRTSSASQAATFTAIFRANAWGSAESVSGPGSTEARGADFQDELIARNSRLHAAGNRRFLCGDMTRADLPRADLIVCRDGLVHLSFVDARAAIRNFRRTGSRYLLATTFVGRPLNSDVPTGGWRLLNLEAPPFAFPAPLALVDERCTHSGGAYRDKRLGLWELGSLVH